MEKKSTKGPPRAARHLGGHPLARCKSDSRAPFALFSCHSQTFDQFEAAVERDELETFLRLKEDYDPELDGKVLPSQAIGVPGALMPQQMQGHKPSFAPNGPTPMRKPEEEMDAGEVLPGYGLQGVKVTMDELANLAKDLGLDDAQASDFAKVLGPSGSKEKVAEPAAPSKAEKAEEPAVPAAEEKVNEAPTTEEKADEPTAIVEETEESKSAIEEYLEKSEEAFFLTIRKEKPTNAAAMEILKVEPTEQPSSTHQEPEPVPEAPTGSPIKEETAPVDARVEEAPTKEQVSEPVQVKEEDDVLTEGSPVKRQASNSPKTNQFTKIAENDVPVEVASTARQASNSPQIDELAKLLENSVSNERTPIKQQAPHSLPTHKIDKIITDSVPHERFASRRQASESPQTPELQTPRFMETNFPMEGSPTRRQASYSPQTEQFANFTENGVATGRSPVRRQASSNSPLTEEFANRGVTQRTAAKKRSSKSPLNKDFTENMDGFAVKEKSSDSPRTKERGFKWNIGCINVKRMDS